MSDQPQAENTAKKKSRSVPLLIVALVLVVGGLLWFASRRHAAKAETATGGAEADPVKSSLHLESFVVNLADPETAFLRISIDLGLSDMPRPSKSDDKASPLLPKVRDCILSVLTTWQSEALLAPEGKTKLKEQLLNALHTQVPELPVREVYFTEFLVQR